MTAHTLALLILGLLLVREGIGIALPKRPPLPWQLLVTSVPLLVFVWWLVLTILL